MIEDHNTRIEQVVGLDELIERETMSGALKRVKRAWSALVEGAAQSALKALKGGA